MIPVSLLLGGSGGFLLGLLLEGRLGESASEEREAGAGNVADGLDLPGASQVRDEPSGH